MVDMLFICHLSINHKEMTKAIKMIKNPKLPEGVKIRESLWLFGKPDAMLIFEATDESTAGHFVIQFGPVAESCTSIAFPIDELRWTL